MGGRAQVVEYQGVMNVKKKMVEVGGFEPPSLAEARSIPYTPKKPRPYGRGGEARLGSVQHERILD